MGSMQHAFTVAALRYADAGFDYDEARNSFEKAQNRLRATLQASGYRIPLGHVYTDNVPAFNDADETTAEDVILMMKKAL
jgi:hypothetical protein